MAGPRPFYLGVYHWWMKELPQRTINGLSRGARVRFDAMEEEIISCHPNLVCHNSTEERKLPSCERRAMPSFQRVKESLNYFRRSVRGETFPRYWHDSRKILAVQFCNFRSLFPYKIAEAIALVPLCIFKYIGHVNHFCINENHTTLNSLYLLFGIKYDLFFSQKP